MRHNCYHNEGKYIAVKDNVARTQDNTEISVTWCIILEIECIRHSLGSLLTALYWCVPSRYPDLLLDARRNPEA